MASETPKGVSSRLLSMKFMQRAAASAASTPTSESDSPSAKKRKLEHGSGGDEFSANIDQASIQAAIEEREAKRQAAIDKHGGSDTHWVLNTDWAKKAKNTTREPRKVIYVGYGDFDTPDDYDAEGGSMPGRMSTKDYQKTKLPAGEKEQTSLEESGDDDESDGNSEEGSNRATPRSRDSTSRPRSRSNSKQRAESSKAKEFRDQRKKKEVRLNKLTSISSAGASQFGSPGNKSMTCFNCHKTGHKASDCPGKGARGPPKRD